MEHGTWNMEHGTWNMEHGTWNMEHGTWNMERQKITIIMKKMYKIKLTNNP